MISSTVNREKIKQKIKKAGSKDAYIISEMVRLGFWDEECPDFSKVKNFLEKEGELSKELSILLEEKRVVDNPEELLKRIHKERMIQSRKNQKETKERKKAEKLEKDKKREAFKKTEITFLGEGYSGLLSQKSSNTTRLKEANLPVINSAHQLALAMNTNVSELRFLAYSRKNAETSHYNRFKIAKKTGGFRLISAPSPRLKKTQTWILENILNNVEINSKAHGCVQEKSIKTNAELHVGKSVVINQDLKNFFPSISYQRVLGAFKSLGYSGQVSTILALICTEPEVVEVRLEDKTYYSQKGERFLPQGSPCSPAISNIICRKLDKRLEGLANKYKYTYSRYVDDITFSGGKEELKYISAILKYSKKIVKAENFRLHPDKLRIMKRGGKQEVTGVVVNQKTNIDKREYKRFKALIFQIEKDGIQGKNWKGNKKILPAIHGYANFIHQINPELGAKIKPRVKSILQRYNYKPVNPYKKEVLKKKKSFLQRIFNLFKG
jgi:hypothetical protein